MAFYVFVRPVGILVLMVAALGGCSKSNRIPTYPVTGEVVFADGRPLPAGSILLESTEHPLSARGLIQAGKFELGTYTTTDGAVAGIHRVAVIPSPPADFDPDGKQTPLAIRPKYLHFDTSELQANVPEGGVEDLRITVD